MVALLLAAVLWQAPAAVSVPNGETRTFDVPAVSGPARLVFRVHAEYWRPAGSNPLLRILVNGNELGLMRDRDSARVAGNPKRADGLARYDVGRWRVSQGPGPGDDLAIDVSDLVSPHAAVRIAFECAPAGSLGPMPLVIEDLRLEAGAAAAEMSPAPASTPSYDAVVLANRSL